MIWGILSFYVILRVAPWSLASWLPSGTWTWQLNFAQRDHPTLFQPVQMVIRRFSIATLDYQRHQQVVTEWIALQKTGGIPPDTDHWPSGNDLRVSEGGKASYRIPWYGLIWWVWVKLGAAKVITSLQAQGFKCWDGLSGCDWQKLCHFNLIPPCALKSLRRGWSFHFMLVSRSVLFFQPFLFRGRETHRHSTHSAGEWSNESAGGSLACGVKFFFLS